MDLQEFLRADLSSMGTRVAERYSDQKRIISALKHKRRVTWGELGDAVKMDEARLCAGAIRLSQMGAVKIEVNAGPTAIYLTPRIRKLIRVPEPTTL